MFAVDIVYEDMLQWSQSQRKLCDELMLGSIRWVFEAEDCQEIHKRSGCSSMALRPR
jgi:hypothetical protein